MWKINDTFKKFWYIDKLQNLSSFQQSTFEKQCIKLFMDMLMLFVIRKC